jgi:predicted PhzF superfamily epimerase YddE/YHI9
VRYGLLGCPIFVAEQGRNVGRPGRVYVEVVMREGRIEAVRIAGEAVTVLRGVLMTEGRYGRPSLGYTGAS